MGKLDRAVYAIFLLMLIADAARVHASVPTGSDGLTFAAANQLQVTPAGEAIVVFRRADGVSAQVARFNCCSLEFSGWVESHPDHKNWAGQFSPPNSAAMLVSARFKSGVDARLLLVSLFLPGSFIASVFKHSGSPAP